MQIAFYIEGEMQLSRVLTGIAANVKDWTPAFEQSGDDLIQFFSTEVFDTEGTAIDSQWAPLSKAYAYQKAKKFPGAGILQATGAMKASFMKQFDSTSMTVWNGSQYFKYHQSNKPRHKLPRRVMMKLTENLKQLVVKNFHERLYEVITS